jgi:nucleotide-binding universal stress UspA family protein
MRASSKENSVTILVAYVPRPEGQAALDKGLEIAGRRKERLVVVNASPGGRHEDVAMADVQDVERVEALLAASGLEAEFKQFVRGKSAVAEIEGLVDALQVSLLVIGLRKRTAVGKLILGSVAQEILLSVSCPVLAVKAN